MGPVGSQEGTSGSRMVPYRSVYQSYTNTGQSSDPSGLVGSRRAKTAFRRVSVGTLFWHDGTRRGSTDRSTGPYRCTIDVRTPWARHGVPTGPPGPRQGSSGPVGPYRVPTGFRRNPDLARRTPTGLDGSLDCPVSVHDSCTDPYGTFRRPHGPSGGPSGPDYWPPADPRRHHRTLFHRRLPGLGGPQLLLASAVAMVCRGGVAVNQCLQGHDDGFS